MGRGVNIPKMEYRMLYKVTPDMEAQEALEKKARRSSGPRQRRKSAVYDSDGHEVLITLMCLKCRKMRPLAQFGLRKMGDGAIRNQPWCRGCRSAATPKKQIPSGEASSTASPAVDGVVSEKGLATSDVVSPLEVKLPLEASRSLEVLPSLEALPSFEAAEILVAPAAN
jgi:hypothetical protein